MLLQRELSGLLLVDVQEKLTPHVMRSEKMRLCCEWLVRLAQTLEVPVLVSEQYPKGLGKTVESLRGTVTTYSPIEKVHFSCFKQEGFMKHWERLLKKQIVIAGIETHVCVLQTAMDIQLNTDNDVFVVVDAVSSRSELDHKYGLKRMKQAGIELVTAEMVFFEWVRQAGTPEFKMLSQSFLQSARSS
jgi:hypothetical protein